MKSWLQKLHTPFPDDLRKPELYQFTHLHKPRQSTYVVDTKSVELGLKGIRLPSYHYHYKTIEMVLAFIKGYVKENPHFLHEKYRKSLHDCYDQIHSK